MTPALKHVNAVNTNANAVHAIAFARPPGRTTTIPIDATPMNSRAPSTPCSCNMQPRPHTNTVKPVSIDAILDAINLAGTNGNPVYITNTSSNNIKTIDATRICGLHTSSMACAMATKLNVTGPLETVVADIKDDTFLDSEHVIWSAMETHNAK